MESELDKKERQDLLEGSFKLDHHPSSRVIRVYLSSEYRDSGHERSHIVEDVFPALHSHSKSLGLQFYAVDMYAALPSHLCCPTNGVRTESGGPKDDKEAEEDGTLYHLERMGVLRLAPKEIKLCQQLSAGPNFVTLLAQRYGFKLLHSEIPQEDYDLLYSVIEEQSDRSLLQQWYQLDTNALPPQYVLRSWDPKLMELKQWMRIHDSLSKTIRKAAKVALGKDVSKVQKYIMSAVEEEITSGIFSLKQNPNWCCFWFKRVFTDLLDQRPSDPSLAAYADMTQGKRGVEFDSESLKVLNSLKEARLPAKYIGLDSSNIFEFLIKWQKGKGLDPVENPSHKEYLQDASREMVAALKEKISAAAECLEHRVKDKVCQEAMHHSVYCKKKASTFMDRPDVTDKLYSYISGTSDVPLVLYGKTGCGKTLILAGTAYKMREKFPLQKMILIMRFIQTSPLSSSIRNTLKSICKQLSGVLEEDPKLIPGDFPSITLHFKTLLSKATSEKPIYILLDGVDQLSPEDGASGMSWLPVQLPPHVKIILSTSSEIKYRCYPVLQSLLSKHPGNLIEIPPLSRKECRTLLAHNLSLRRRTLSGDQETATMLVLLRCPFPLYMSLLLVEVEQWKSYHESRPWEIAAPPTTLNGITEGFFHRLEAEFGAILFGHLAGYLSATKYGLTEMELLDVLSHDQQVMEDVNQKWTPRTVTAVGDGDSTPSLSRVQSIPPMLWSLAYQRLQPLVELYMGAGECHVIRWAHKFFSEYATSRYLSSENQTHCIYTNLADYFSGKYAIEKEEQNRADSSPFHQPLFLHEESGLYNVRKLAELPLCLARSGRKEELQDLLTDYSWVKGKICTQSCADLVEEFSAVLPVVPLQRSKKDSSSFYELSLLRDALTLSIPALNADSAQLPAQLYGRLIPFVGGENPKRPVLERLLDAALEDCQSPLIPLMPLQHLPGGPLFLTMKGHRAATSALAVTTLTSKHTGETGLCIVSSSWDKTLKSWDLSTTGVLKTFDGHADKVLSVALTTDGQYTASGSADMTVRLWYVPTAECMHVMHGHKAAVNAVVMTTCGSKTISGSSDGTIKVWNTDINSSSCGEAIFTMKNLRSPVLSLALFKDHFLASGARSSVTSVMDIVSGEVKHSIKGEEGPVTALAIVQVERIQYLLMGFQSGKLCVRGLESGKLVHLLKPNDAISNTSNTGNNSSTNDVGNTGNTNNNSVHSIAVSTKGKVVTSYENGCLSVWSLLSGSHLYNFTGHCDSVLGLCLADEGNLVITGCRDSSLQIWDLLSPPPLGNRQHENIAASVSISPCGTYGVSGGGDSKLKLYDLENTSIVGEIDTAGASRVTQVLVLRDSQRILVARQDGSMHLWNGVTQELLVRFKGHPAAAVNCIAISLDSGLVMSGGEDYVVAFWSVKSGAKLKAFTNHSASVVGVAFTRDRMVSASRDGQVCVRDFKTAKVLLTSATHAEEVLCLAVSPNAAFFVTGSCDKTCHVVDLNTGQLRSILKGNGGPVTCVRVLSNCAQCLTGSQDGCLRIWDVEGGGCSAELCTDAPLTSCDISWKCDHVLYGTKGGWVSSVAYKAKEKVRHLVLRKTQGCESGSALSTTESESTASTADRENQELREEADGEEKGEEKIEDNPGDHSDSNLQQNQLNNSEKTEFVRPKDDDVDVAPHQQTGSSKHKEAGVVNGFIQPSIETDKAAALHKGTSKENVVVLETSKEAEVEEGKTETTKVTSSACLIL